MEVYSGFQPTQFDPKGLGCEEQQDWFVGPCSTNRDARALTRANWKALIAALEEVDPEGNDHEEHRFGHWGPGWFEIVLIRPESEACRVAERIENALADYPCVDETLYSLEETEEAEEIWQSWNTRERVDHIQRVNIRDKGIEDTISIFAARRDNCPIGVASYIREHYS